MSGSGRCVFVDDGKLHPLLYAGGGNRLFDHRTGKTVKNEQQKVFRKDFLLLFFADFFNKALFFYVQGMYETIVTKRNTAFRQL